MENTKIGYINNLADLDDVICEIDVISSGILFGDLYEDEAESGEFTEITCLLIKAKNHSELAEMELRQASILLREKAQCQKKSTAQ
jgi:hypothetical protein